MEPEIRYSRTPDGVNIAYWVMGAGPPLVYLPPLQQHAALDWQIPNIRDLYEWLTSTHRVVRIDTRNTGLSDRGVADVSPEAQESDIQAVVERLGLEPFTLFGQGMSGHVAVGFAAHHPDLVKRLVLVNAILPFPDVVPPPRVLAVASLLQLDWEMYTEAIGALSWGWNDTDRRPRTAELLRQSTTWEDAKRLSFAPNIIEMLHLVKAPTLIVHHRDALVTSAETARQIAGAIADARLVTLEGQGVGLSGGDPRMRAAVDAFLAEDAPSQILQGPGTAIILFTDIADSTALTERLGDAAFRDHARTLDDALRTIIRDNGGTAIDGKLLGDGVLATFPAASQAIAAALACEAACDGTPLKLHLGLHAGDVIRESNNVFGGAVNIASRICALSAPGEILVSATVRDLARTPPASTFDDRGEHDAQGHRRPRPRLRRASVER